MAQQDHKHSLSPGQPWICVQLTQGRQRRKSSSAYVLTQRSFVFPLSALHPPLKTKHSSPGKYCDGQPGVVVFSFFAITCWWGVGGGWWWYFERSVVVMLIFKGQPIVAIPEMKKWCKGKEEPQGNFFFFLFEGNWRHFKEEEAGASYVGCLHSLPLVPTFIMSPRPSCRRDFSEIPELWLTG